MRIRSSSPARSAKSLLRMLGEIWTATAARVALRPATPAGRRTGSADDEIAVRPDALALTYAYDALDRVTSDGSLGGRGTVDVLVTCAVILLALALGAATLRRRTA